MSETTTVEAYNPVIDPELPWCPDDLKTWQMVLHCQFNQVRARYPGVYAVFSTADELIYVGQTGDVKARLLTHRKRINAIGLFQVGFAHVLWSGERRERREIERRILSDIRPRFNRSFPSDYIF